MRVCLMIEGQEGVTWQDWVRLARLVEDHGLEGLFRSDHYTAIIRPQAGALDAWTTLAGLAASRASRPIATFLSIRGGEADAEQMLEERRPTWLAGTVEEVAARISELEALGVDRVMLQHLNHSDDDMVALIGEQLIPALA